MITPVGQILLPADHGPLHPGFKHESTVTTKLEKFLLDNQTQTQQSLPLQPAASSEAAGPAGTAFFPVVAATNHVTNMQPAQANTTRCRPSLAGQNANTYSATIRPDALIPAGSIEWV